MVLSKLKTAVICYPCAGYALSFNAQVLTCCTWLYWRTFWTERMQLNLL